MNIQDLIEIMITNTITDLNCWFNILNCLPKACLLVFLILYFSKTQLKDKFLLFTNTPKLSFLIFYNTKKLRQNYWNFFFKSRWLLNNLFKLGFCRFYPMLFTNKGLLTAISSKHLLTATFVCRPILLCCMLTKQLEQFNKQPSWGHWL